MLALAIVGAEPWRQAISPPLAILGIAYLAAAFGLWGARRWMPAGLHLYAGLALDVTAVTFFLALGSPFLLPLWLLYLLPLVAASRAGRRSLAVATVLSVAGLLVTQGIATGLTMTAVVWPALTLTAMAVALDVATDPINAGGRAPDAARQQVLATTREELRRAQVFGQAAARLLATFDEATVRDIVVESAGIALAREVSLVERSTGQVVAGAAGLADSLLRTVVDRAMPLEGKSDNSSAVSVPYGLAVRSIADQLVLVVDAADSRLTSAEMAWLDDLTSLAQAALVRCAEYRQVYRDLQTARGIVERLPAPLAVWDRNGQCVLANEALRALPPESTTPNGFATAEVREEERVVEDPPRTFVVTLVPFSEDQWVIALYREVTRERAALRAKDELIAVIGHELRSPLTSIHGYSQMMARQLGVVQDQVNRLNHMIADFMIAARLEGGQLPLQPEAMDLVALVKAAADRFRGASPERPLLLDLPDEAFVEGDASRLSQVLDNLLNNAEKYSPPGREIALRIRPDSAEGEVVLSVADQGIGIASEHLPYLFDRFYRAPSTEAQQAKGLGLGLSIVRDLVAAHGGRIWVESAGEGQGSTFWVSLPAATRPADQASIALPDAPDPDARADQSRI